MLAVGKSYREDAATHFAETVVALFLVAVGHVFGDDAMRVGKSMLGLGKRNAVFLLIVLVFFLIPLEARHGHGNILSQDGNEAISLYGI